MARISLAGFKDPVRRPRFIIWTGTAVLFLAAFVVFAMGIASSRWFCADVCHKVQDDAMVAYSHSSHAEISCGACHIPVNADPITFVYHKILGALGVPPTVTNTYELPLNPESELALSQLHMPEVMCTQCHNMKTRKVTASEGIIIDHEVHSKAGYQCTVCHNRVGHREDFTLTLPGNRKHADFMEMDACFRCHGLQPDAKAPGQCNACHPKDFTLKPEYHLEPGFYPKGHAEDALAAEEKVHEAEVLQKGLETPEAKAKAEKLKVQELPLVEAVSHCETCHVKKDFCDKCHGMEMPHPQSFIEPADDKDAKAHPAMSKSKATAAKCEFCHHQKKTFFCDSCHHGAKVNWTFDAKQPWHTQHAKTVVANGVDGCLGKCHDAKFCSDCHNREKPLPSSHKAGTWLHGKQVVSKDGKPKTAQPGAAHVASALKSPAACAVCHGGDGTAKSAFCKGCHKLDMPHTDQFRSFHSATGKQNPGVCSNCHQFKELCSNCHHAGAADNVSWTQQHPKAVYSGGGGPCFEKCHKDKNFCINCHNSGSGVVPATHKAGDWLHRRTVSAKAGHTTLFAKSPEGCTYCHGDNGAKARFCVNCHKMDMPHPDTFGKKGKGNGGDHQAGFKAKKLTKASCANCHSAQFCNSCHHEGSTGRTAWAVAKVGTAQEHPSVVKSKGSAPCFECHQETFCSYCHVRAN